MSLGKIAVGVAAGVAAGVAVGLLLAPEKGSDLREKIAGGEYTDDLKEGWNHFLTDLTEKLGWKEEALQFAHASTGGGDGSERRTFGGEDSTSSTGASKEEATGAGNGEAGGAATARGGARGGAGARKTGGGVEE